MPGGEIKGDLEIHLEGAAGWARASRFNNAIHAISVIAHQSDASVEEWDLAVQINPDAWHPAKPLAATFSVELHSGQGRFRGDIDGDLVTGGAERLAAPIPSAGILHLLCQQFLEDGRMDFRDLRLELPVTPETLSPGRGVTLHERWPLAAIGIDSSAWDGTFLKARVTISHPAVEWLPENPRSITVTIEAERRGCLLRGRWHREDNDAKGELWGELRVKTLACHRKFTAPGMILGAEDIAGARARIAAGGKWTPAWALLHDRAASFRSWQPRPHARPLFVHWNEPGTVRDLKEDCEAAWGNTLLYVLGLGGEHADAAARIIHGWATTFKGIADIGGHLSTSYCFPAMVWAADLLRAHARLDSQVDCAFRRCLSEVVRPIALTELHANNWRTWSIHLEACIAVYCERGDWFDSAIARHRIMLDRYTHSPSGITSETGRDLVHAQMGIAPMIATSELAWRQGVDLYSEQQMRLRAAVELHGPFAMGRMEGWPLKNPAKQPGTIWPMYEMAVRHYKGRLGLPMPRSCSVLEASRPEKFNRIGWGTLLHPWEGEIAGG